MYSKVSYYRSRVAPKNQTGKREQENWNLPLISAAVVVADQPAGHKSEKPPLKTKKKK